MHLVPALRPVAHVLRRVGVELVGARVVVVRDGLHLRALGQIERLRKLVPDLPVEPVVRHAQDDFFLARRIDDRHLVVPGAIVHVWLHPHELCGLVHDRLAADLVVRRTCGNLEIARADGRRRQMPLLRRAVGENDPDRRAIRFGLAGRRVVHFEHDVRAGRDELRRVAGRELLTFDAGVVLREDVLHGAIARSQTTPLPAGVHPCRALRAADYRARLQARLSSTRNSAAGSTPSCDGRRAGCPGALRRPSPTCPFRNARRRARSADR